MACQQLLLITIFQSLLKVLNEAGVEWCHNSNVKVRRAKPRVAPQQSGGPHGGEGAENLLGQPQHGDPRATHRKVRRWHEPQRGADLALGGRNTTSWCGRVQLAIQFTYWEPGILYTKKILSLDTGTLLTDCTRFIFNSHKGNLARCTMDFLRPFL